jgi:hypothetical protein
VVAIKPVPPGTLKKILERAGYGDCGEDVYNWVMVKGDDGIPITLPKLGDLVPVDVMMNALHLAGIDNLSYFTFLQEASAESVGPAPN